MLSNGSGEELKITLTSNLNQLDTENANLQAAIMNAHLPSSQVGTPSGNLIHQNLTENTLNN